MATEVKKSNSIFHLAILTLLVILLAAFSFFKSQKNPQLGEILPSPLNYKFVYHDLDGIVNIYDLEKDATVSAQIKGDLAWSKTGGITVLDKKGFIYLVDDNANAKQLTDKVRIKRNGSFFWKSDGSGLYVAENFGNEGPYETGVPDSQKKAYFVLTNGEVSKITPEEFNKAWDENNLETKKDIKASFDGNYIYNYVHESSNTTKLVYLPTKSEFNLPFQSKDIQLSAGNTYMAYRGDSSQYLNGLVILRSGDVFKGILDKPVFTFPYSDWNLQYFEWIDDSRIVFSSIKRAYDYNMANRHEESAIQIADLNTGKATQLINKDGKDIIYVKVSPNKKRLAFIEYTTVKSGAKYPFGVEAYLVVVNLMDGQEIKRIPYQYQSGETWIDPINH